MVGDSPMAVSKVVLADGRTLIDLTGVSVAPDTLAQGATALDKSGNLITGEMAAGTKVYEGTITAGSTSLDFNIKHGLGKTPSVLLIYTNGTHSGTSYLITYDVANIYIAGFGAFRGYYSSGSAFSCTRTENASMPYQVTTFDDTTVAGTLITRTGHTYKVVMF